MKVIKILLFFLLPLSAIVSYFCLRPSVESFYEKALMEIEKKDWLAAEKSLKEVETKHPNDWNPIYKGYLHLSKGEFDKAFSLGKMALKKFETSRNPQTNSNDLYLFLASTAYLLNSEALFQEYLCHVCIEDAFYQLLSGLGQYQKKNYDCALKMWNNSTSIQEGELPNQWRRICLEPFFNNHFFEQKMAFCHLQLNHFTEARSILEKEIHTIDGQNEWNQILMGLSYVKEAESYPLDKRTGYYKLAQYYLSSNCLPSEFFKEKNETISDFKKQIFHLLGQLPQVEENHFPFLCEAVFFYIHYLEGWDLNYEYEEIAKKAVCCVQTLIESEQFIQAKQLCYFIKNQFENSQFAQIFAHQMMNNLHVAIEEGLHQSLLPYLDNVLEFFSNEKTEKQICDLIVKKIYNEVQSQNFSLPELILYISHWSNIEKNAHAKRNFINGLMYYAELLWRNEGQEKKATNLMEICFSLSKEEDKHFLFQRARNYLTALYKLAKEANTVRRLALIFDAMDHLHIDHQELIEQEHIANHLADALYLFHQDSYSSALCNAEWVLKLDPHNQQALWIMGLSYFYQGDYFKAQEVLTLLTDPDEKALKALVLCNLFRNQQLQKQIAAQIQKEE